MNMQQNSGFEESGNVNQCDITEIKIRYFVPVLFWRPCINFYSVLILCSITVNELTNSHVNSPKTHVHQR